MLKKYKNQIFEIARNSDLNLEQFIYQDVVEKQDDDTESKYFSIKYAGTPFMFLIFPDFFSFDFFQYQYTRFAPEFPMSSMDPFMDKAVFKTVLGEFSDWTHNIKRYLEDKEEIDLWAEYRKTNSPLNVEQIDSNDNEPFNAEEKVQVNIAIDNFKRLTIERFELTDAQIDLISDRMDHLISLTENLSKFDWKAVAVSTVVGIGIALSLDTEVGNDLIELFKQVFSSIRVISG